MDRLTGMAAVELTPTQMQAQTGMHTHTAGPTVMPIRGGLAGLPATMARHAVRSLHGELALYPKPGLVSMVDNGSHADMTAATFVRSLGSLRHYFKQITLAGIGGADFSRLATLGVQAEARMLAATGGVNTHRGAIFCLGLLCAAVGRAHACRIDPDAAAIRATLVDAWGAALQGHGAARLPAANGTRVALVHAVGGARSEAAAGLPSVFEIGLPALRATLLAGRGWHCACTDAFFSLLAAVDDTTVYHRGGAAGAALVRTHGQRFMEAGGTADPGWRQRALASHRLFVERRLSPGGVADLLAATCLVQRATHAVPRLGVAREPGTAPTLHKSAVAGAREGVFA